MNGKLGADFGSTPFGLNQVTPDPRPTSGSGGMGLRKREGSRRFRHVADATEWAKIRDAKLGRCLVCRWLGVEQTLASSLHHVVSKSLGGDDCEDNCVPVCGSGVTGHHGLLEAHDEVTCQAFAAAVQQYDDAAYAYAVSTLGEDRFLARYKVRFEDAA